MCGIAGILYSQAISDPAEEKKTALSLSAMQSAIAHRGPDGRGTYISPSKHAAITHTRLAVIDLSDSGQQPMSSTDGRYTISYNGEIYNYKKLRTQLEQSGEEFSGNSDTEVILKLYATKGENCVHSLRGMFAFLIWDEQTKRGFAARDALGIKPFYYRNKGGVFAFASELRAVLASGLSSQRISSRGVLSYLQRGSVTEPDTAIRDIKALPAGSYLYWNGGKSKVVRYWKPRFETVMYQPPKAIEMTRTALEHSVRAHLVSDVPVGIFLSGGIDSSVLVALATKLSRKQINTYSIAFEDPAWNEGDIASRVAQHFGTNHTEFLMTPEKARPLYSKFLEAIDQPTIDGFNTFCIAKLASEKGEKVVLSGLGADELFAGYKSFSVLPDMLDKSAKLAKIGFIVRPILNKIDTYLSGKQRRIADATRQPDSLVAAHQSLRGIFSNSEADHLTKVVCSKTAKRALINEPSHATLADSISDLELSVYMRNQLLRDSDVASMAWGLELRVPFVDRVFVEQISAIPSSLRLAENKQLLKACMPELPDWVVNRPKQGFRFPFDQWFANEWHDMPLPETPKWISLKPWYRRWSLTVLQDWKARYVK